jgi:hypothetical protein
MELSLGETYQTFVNLLESNGRSVLSLHVELEQWDDAFAIKRLHPEIEDDVTLPYAQWLINHDRYDHAQLAYFHVDRPDLSERLLIQLMDNAVSINSCSTYISLKGPSYYILFTIMPCYVKVLLRILQVIFCFDVGKWPPVEGEEVQGWSSSL